MTAKRFSQALVAAAKLYGETNERGYKYGLIEAVEIVATQYGIDRQFRPYIHLLIFYAGGRSLIHATAVLKAEEEK